MADPRDDPSSPPSYRVVQWATGNIGRHALRAVLSHPNMTLAGVYVHDQQKAGLDAGELCGTASTGVTATCDIDEIVALGADCVLYMPRKPDVDEQCRLLASGANIVSTCGDFHRAASVDQDVRVRIEAACAEGGTSVHSTGSSPGFISEAVPLALTSIQRRLDNLTIDEYADLSQRDSPGLLFDVMGFGRTPDAFDERRFFNGEFTFGPSLAILADALSLPLDSITSSGEFALATQPVEIAAGTIAAGTVAAQRMVVSGMRDGRPLVRFRSNWYCTTEIDPAWTLRPGGGWHVAVDGDAPLAVDVRLDVPLERMSSVTPGYTANRAVNAVPFVCSAAPGIRSVLDLAQIIPVLG